MADYFLGEEDGFMLLDDPLVDMDPDRQKAAAAALKAFAARRQLIVFTCHPATAALLGAKPIMLGGTCFSASVRQRARSCGNDAVSSRGAR